MLMSSILPSLDSLGTPVAWADREGRVLGVNPAFARWLGVSARRLVDQPLAALEVQGDALARFLLNDERDVLRLHRLALGLPNDAPRLPKAGCRGWTTAAGYWKPIRSTNSPHWTPPMRCPMP